MQIRFLSILLVLITLGFNFNLSAQEKGRVTIENSDWGGGRPDLGKNVLLLTGNVELKHQNTLMYCDSAYHHNYNDSTFIEAFNNIHIMFNYNYRIPIIDQFIDRIN